MIGTGVSATPPRLLLVSSIAMYLTKRFNIYEIGKKKYLLINGLSGSIDKITEDQLRWLKLLSNGKKIKNLRFYSFLKKRGYIFDSRQQEDKVFYYLCKKIENFCLSTSPDFEFVINSFCNFNCVYCFEDIKLRKRNLAMIRGQIDLAFKAINDKLLQGRKKLNSPMGIFGGEPLLPGAKKTIRYLFDNIAKRGYKAYFVTNGYYINDFSEILDRYRKHIDSVQVTIDGPKETHDRRRMLRGGSGTFDRIVSGVDQLLKMRIKTSVRMNIDGENIAYLKEFADFVRQKAWSRSRYFKLIPAAVNDHCQRMKKSKRMLSPDRVLKGVLPFSKDFGGGPYDLVMFRVLKHVRKHFNLIKSGSKFKFNPLVVYCSADLLMRYVFHPDGRIYPCNEIAGVRKYAIGEYCPTLRIFSEKERLWKKRTILMSKKCRECSIATFCGGGCAVAALVGNGSMYEPNCDNAPLVLKAFIRHLKDRHSVK